MKISSTNIRGIRKKKKRREVRELVQKYKFDLCCIQEMKMEVMKSFLCKSIWNLVNFDWVCVNSIGNSGGILTIWDKGAICRVSSWENKGYLVVNGFWREYGKDCCIINIYAFCIHAKKIETCDSINIVVQQN